MEKKTKSGIIISQRKVIVDKVIIMFLTLIKRGWITIQNEEREGERNRCII